MILPCSKNAQRLKIPSESGLMRVTPKGGAESDESARFHGGIGSGYLLRRVTLAL
jgi:hypothetical protein